jgi:transposase
VGKQMNSPLIKDKDQAFQLYTDVKTEIREELESIVNRRDSTEGLATLQKSLALSNTYKDLLSQIQSAETEEQLESLEAQVTTETDVYAQRAKHLQKLYAQRVELVRASNVSLEDSIKEVQTITAKKLEDCDF